MSKRRETKKRKATRKGSDEGWGMAAFAKGAMERGDGGSEGG